METFKWIGKTDTPRLDWGKDGDNASAVMEAAKGSITPESNSVIFRKEYIIDKKVKKATLKVCGLGLYEFYINGEKIGDYVLSPLETNYRKKVLYDEFDITDKLAQGCNCFGAEVGNGRYSTPKKYWDWRAGWYGDPCLTAKIIIEYYDGCCDVFDTDSSWKCNYGPIYENCFYDGEGYDANRELNGWKSCSFCDSDWTNALVVDEPGGVLEKNKYFHIKKIREIKPQKVYKNENGSITYRFAENIPGWVGVTVKGNKGDTVKIRYAEREENGCLNVSSNERARDTDFYCLNDKEVQYYEPKFTLRGFSAVEITANSEAVEIVDITAFIVHSDLRKIGDFWCDNSDINRLHDVILRTQKAALMSYPMDCPQRDERLGWGADAHVTDLTCMYNFDMINYYEKWLDDIKHDSHSEEKYICFISPWHTCGHAIDWSAAYPIIIWDHYIFYRDKTILEKHCDTLIAYVEYLRKKGNIQEKTRYGDWMSVHEGWNRGDPESCSSLFYYYDLLILIDILGELEKIEEQKEYITLSKEVKTSILDKFFNTQELIFDNNSQFCISFALKLKLIPDEYRANMLNRLIDDIKNRDYHLTTGILGTKYLCEILSEYAPDVLMKLLFQKTYPSWLNLIENKTTLSETWDGYRSQNHCMFGSVDATFYSMLLGIKVGRKLTVSPYFAKEINRASGGIKFKNGSINVEWQRKNSDVYLHIVIDGEIKVEYINDNKLDLLAKGSYDYVIK